MERIIGGLNLPLPDAKPDKRIYELLKTVDLENLTFADFQGVAKTIYAEQGAEDELRRIVLVNLARLAVKGNWDGLTTSGGGGDAGYGVYTPTSTTGSYDGYELASLAPWGVKADSASNMNAPAVPTAYPFVATETGDLSEVEIYVNSKTAGSTLVVAFYENDSTNNVPGNLLGYVTLDTATSIGEVSQTSFSSTVSLTKGTQYWVAVAKGTSAYAGIKGIADNYRLGLGLSSNPLNFNNAAFYGLVDFISPNVPVNNIGTITQYTGGTLPAIIIKY